MTGRIVEIVKGKKYKVIIEAGKDPATGKRKRIIRRVAGRQPDAQALMSQIITELRQGTYIEPKRITVSSWLKTWLNDYKKLELRQTTFDSYKIQIDTHIIPAIGEINIQDLRPDHLQKLYNDKLAAGLSPRSVRYIHTVMHGALEQAVKNQLVLRNVSRATALPKKKKGQVRALTSAEQAEFLAAARGDRLYPAFVVLMATGLRRGELLGLRWRDIDLTRGRLTVDENLVTVKGAAVYQPPKTEKSRGRVPLIKPALDALKSHKERMMFEKYFEEDKPVFCTKVGTPINPRNFNRAFERIRDKWNRNISPEKCAECKNYKKKQEDYICDLAPDKLDQCGSRIGEDITVHSLRHTFATRLLERGVSMREVQELLRHEEMATTADIYSHVSEELKQAAADRLADLF